MEAGRLVGMEFQRYESVEQDGKLLSTKRLKAAELPRVIEQFSSDPGARVLNTLPAGEAFEAYLRLTAPKGAV